MAKGTLAERIRTVLLYVEHRREPIEVCSLLDISLSTFWRWIRTYRKHGASALERRRPGPALGSATNSVSKIIQARILELKQKHPSWGARRIKYQYNLPCHWRTVHRIIKRNGNAHQNQTKTPNHLPRDSSESMLTRCGRVIPSSSA